MLLVQAYYFLTHKNEQRDAQTKSSGFYLIRRLQGHASHRCNIANFKLGKAMRQRLPIDGLMCFSATLRLYLMFTVLE